jgi:hypothetical protein
MITETPHSARPGFFGGTYTKAEDDFADALSRVQAIDPKLWVDLESSVGRRVDEAYRYGVSAGLGQLLPEDVDLMDRNAALQAIADAIEAARRLTERIGHMNELSRG